MLLLGISCFYHDAAACLIKNGKLIAAAEEERFTRKKHDISFPLKAITYCLEEGGITGQELDAVAFYEKPLLKFERLLSQHLEMFPYSFPAFLRAMPSWFNEKLRVPTLLKKRLNYKGKVYFIEHHLAHAASAFLVSPFRDAAIFTVDGVGEWATTTYGYAKDNDITLLKELRFPHSLGLLYSTITALLGFSVNNSEYKVMGLSPYGKPAYYEQFRKFIDIKEDGSYQLDMSYFDYHYRLTMPGTKMQQLLGSIRTPESEVTQHHKDIAATLQAVTEEVLFKGLNHLHREVKMDNLCMAGGVALNSVANGKIYDRTPFKHVFIQPAASDAGTSLGAAFYVYNTVLKNPRRYVMDTAYHGPGFSEAHLKEFLAKHAIVHSEFKTEEELQRATANLLHENHVVGWFQGRMEWGPRALGNRSILSNACNPEMQGILNAKVKHREHFRPFAPVVPLEDAPTYFELKAPEPFMLFVYPVKEEFRKKIPAVTHVDGSGRLQTIERHINPRYYGVLKEFGKLSGIPILVNTSFNIRGEPIVRTPEEAYRCMMGTGIDYLVLGRFLVAQKDNPQDKWDSEALAKD